MRFQRILHFACIVLFLGLLFSMTSLPADATSRTPSGSEDVCASTQWLTVGLADVYQGAYHLHVQLQALFDGTATNTYCGRVIANSYLDAPGSSNGSLDAEIYWGPTFLQNEGYTNCQVPSQCPVLSQDTIRGLTKFEAGGPGHDVVLDTNHRAGDTYTVKACGSYTEASTDPNNPNSNGPNTIKMTCTDAYTPPGLPILVEF